MDQPTDNYVFNLHNRKEGESILRGKGLDVRVYGGVYSPDNKIFPLGFLGFDGTYRHCMKPRKPVEEATERLTKELEPYIQADSAPADAQPSIIESVLRVFWGI